MAVISIRLNDKESKILKKLSMELELDQSSLIKKSLMATYEDMIDRGVIEKFEKSAKIKKAEFLTFEEVIK